MGALAKMRSLPYLLDALIPLIREAGETVMAVYASDFAVDGKADDSPVTEADRRAEGIITAGLRRLAPGIPVIGEEAVAEGTAPRIATGDDARFWLVDPVDGTKEFIGRNGEFTVNIGLIEGGRPVLGLVLAPALGQLYAGGPGLGAWREDGDTAPGRRQPIACRPEPVEGLTVLGSRSHGDAAALGAFLQGRRVAAVRSAGSSLKLCLLAAGEADVYPRFGRTMEWDIAAGHAVLAGAGGAIEVLPGGGPLSYGKSGWENPHFVAWGASSAATLAGAGAPAAAPRRP